MTSSGKHIVIITGMSGSGKSTAIRALEDAGFFCIDNLPVLLLPKLTELAGGGDIDRMALVVDVREGVFLKEAPRVLDEVRRAGHQVEVLFLDAGDDSLIRRFSETRRRHPLAPTGSVAEGIHAEREALRDLRELADQVIDSSALNVHDLKRMVQARFSPEPAAGPSLSIMSFGYRHGVPPQADLVFDVRFLPNPYWIPQLRGQNGTDAPVRDYVLAQNGALAFVDRYLGALDVVIEGYEHENRSHMTIALGCTGGKHRSVAMSEELGRRLAERTTASVTVRHRDLGRE